VRIGIVLLILALDWAALQDIVEGEPDVRAEWIFVFLSLAVFIIMIIDWTRDRKSKRKG
jgi:hypothetical protein